MEVWHSQNGHAITAFQKQFDEKAHQEQSHCHSAYIIWKNLSTEFGTISEIAQQEWHEEYDARKFTVQDMPPEFVHAKHDAWIHLNAMNGDALMAKAALKEWNNQKEKDHLQDIITGIKEHPLYCSDYFSDVCHMENLLSECKLIYQTLTNIASNIHRELLLVGALDRGSIEPSTRVSSMEENSSSGGSPK